KVVRLFLEGKLHDQGTPDWVKPSAELGTRSAELQQIRAPGATSVTGEPFVAIQRTELHQFRSPGSESCAPIDWLALNAAVNSTANLEMKEGKLITVGNSTEGALLSWLHEAGLEYQKIRLQFDPLYQIHFS